jgi:hypothetical protein
MSSALYCFSANIERVKNARVAGIRVNAADTLMTGASDLLVDLSSLSERRGGRRICLWPPIEYSALGGSPFQPLFTPQAMHQECEHRTTHKFGSGYTSAPLPPCP